MLIRTTLSPLMLYKREMAAGCLLYETGAHSHMQQAFVCTRPDVQPLLCLHEILRRPSSCSPQNASFPSMCSQLRQRVADGKQANKTDSRRNLNKRSH